MAGKPMSTDINFIEGSVVGYAGENWRITTHISLDLVQLESVNWKSRKTVAVRDITPPLDNFSAAVQQNLPFGDSKDRDEAIRMLELIRPLLSRSGRTKDAVRKRAVEYGVSESKAYRLIARWEQYGRLEVLARGKSRAGKGVSRLPPAVEEVIQAALPLYLNRQRYATKDIAVAVRRACEAQGLPRPHLNTIRSRIRSLSSHLVAKTRHGRAAAMKLEDHSAPFDRATTPLSVVEIDHSVLDVTVVDNEYRRPIGRDVWITLALDVFSRMVVGYYVSLDPVGDVSTGMCVAHAILAKDDWLREHQVNAEWPCWGPMDCIHVDNARDFRGRMLRRACERYGIELNFRPVGRPHFGGHIERFFGSLSKELHKLPGTTFSNVRAKADYDSVGRACFTFDELESFIALWITVIYHGRFHQGIKTTPLQKYREGFVGPTKRSLPRLIGDAVRLRRDFMPFVERTIQPGGVEIDHVHYSGLELSKWIGAREPGTKKSRKFIFARDPRDISTVYFYDPDLDDYCPIYRTDSEKTTASIWELREANRKLEAEGRKHVDETLIFEKVVELRERAIGAAKKTKAARRKVQKLKEHSKLRPVQVGKEEPAISEEDELAPYRPLPRPFDSTPVNPFVEVEKL